MKKKFYIIYILFIGVALFSSCNNKLKDDLEELEKQAAEIRDQQNQTKAILGANEPITVSTSFSGDNADNKTISATYSFKAGDNSTQYMRKNEDGSFNIRIERFSDVEWNEGVRLTFTYNPLTKTISNKTVRHYWDDNDQYSDQIRYIFGYSTEPIVDITIHSIDTNNGNISLSVAASGSGQYTEAIAYEYSYSYVPNPGSSVITNFSFTGKLKVFEVPESLPVRESAK